MIGLVLKSVSACRALVGFGPTTGREFEVEVPARAVPLDQWHRDPRLGSSGAVQAPSPGGRHVFPQDLRWQWVAIVGLCLAVAPLAAQTANTGTLIPGRESSAPIAGAEPVPKRDKSPQMTQARIREINAAREMVRQYSNCVLTTLNTAGEHRTLVQFLKTPPLTPEAKVLAEKLKRPDCLPMNGADYVEVRLTNDLVRGGLIRALYVDTQRAQPRYRMLPEELGSGVAAGDAVFDHMRTFGTCVVSKQASDAQRFVLSKVGSPDELSAIRALSPALNGCFAKGPAAHFSFGVMEGVLAEALLYQQNAVLPTGATKALN